jgi:hypothetical protein
MELIGDGFVTSLMRCYAISTASNSCSPSCPGSTRGRETSDDLFEWNALPAELADDLDEGRPGPHPSY